VGGASTSNAGIHSVPFREFVATSGRGRAGPHPTAPPLGTQAGRSPGPDGGGTGVLPGAPPAFGAVSKSGDVECSGFAARAPFAELAARQGYGNGPGGLEGGATDVGLPAPRPTDGQRGVTERGDLADHCTEEEAESEFRQWPDGAGDVDSMLTLLARPITAPDVAATPLGSSLLPPELLDRMASRVLRRCLVGRDGSSTTVRLELGEGRFEGASVLVQSEQGRVSIRVEGDDREQCRELVSLLRARLSVRGVAQADVVHEST
jgi:hypothetical protein